MHHDLWDYDNAAPPVLGDLKVGGRTIKAVMQANKNGFFYVLDRLTGEFLSAQPFSRVTWAKGIDQKTGRPIINKEVKYGRNPVPVSPGGETQREMAFRVGVNLVMHALTGNYKTDVVHAPALLQRLGNER